jgi:hypothetical protein
MASAQIQDSSPSIIFLYIPKFVIGYGDAFPNVVIGFRVIKVIESVEVFYFDLDIIFLDVPKFVIGYGNAFPNVIIGFWVIKVIESVEMLKFMEVIGLAFVQGPEMKLFWMGIQGREFPFKLDTGQREGRISGVNG